MYNHTLGTDQPTSTYSHIVNGHHNKTHVGLESHCVIQLVKKSRGEKKQQLDLSTLVHIFALCILMSKDCNLVSTKLESEAIKVNRSKEK